MACCKARSSNLLLYISFIGGGNQSTHYPEEINGLSQVIDKLYHKRLFDYGTPHNQNTNNLFNDSIIIFTNFKTFYLPSYTFSWEKNKFFHSIIYTVDINYALIYSQTLDWCRMNQQYYFKLVYYSHYYIDAYWNTQVSKWKKYHYFIQWIHCVTSQYHRLQQCQRRHNWKCHWAFNNEKQVPFWNLLLAQTKV